MPILTMTINPPITTFNIAFLFTLLNSLKFTKAFLSAHSLPLSPHFLCLVPPLKCSFHFSSYTFLMDIIFLSFSFTWWPFLYPFPVVLFVFLYTLPVSSLLTAFSTSLTKSSTNLLFLFASHLTSVLVLLGLQHFLFFLHLQCLYRALPIFFAL